MSGAERSLQLLVVEDNPGDVRLLQLALAEAPSFQFSMTHFDQLGDALNLVRSGRAFDAALVDLGLPDSQGLDTLRSLVRVSDELPVLVLTSIDDESLGVRAMQDGAEDYLTKGRPSGKEIARAVRYAIERKRMGLELRRARDAALESARLKAAFLANMSHEIRTPLNIITGFGALIEDRARALDDALLSENVECMNRACARLLQTVDNILDMSKIEARSFALHPASIDVGRLLVRVTREFQALAEEKGLTLKLTARANATVLFDEYCLVHALRNLLQNAVKFSKEGGIEIRIGRDPRGELEIAVTDTGVGIGETYLPRLFDAFTQEQEGYTREFEGSGLGLALTRRYLALNGATVSVESRVGEGSTFTIGIPRRCEVESVPSPLAAPAASRAPQSSREVPLVLVVEDDAATQLYMRRLLAGRYRVLIADGAEQMFECLEQGAGEVRMVLMDISLRGSVDGLELTRRLHEDERWKNIPVIAVTAHTLQEDRRRVLEAGCDAFLAKPFESSRLFGLMDELLTSPVAAAARRGALLN